MRPLLCMLLLITILSSCKEEVTPTPFTFSKVFTGEVSKTWQIEYIELTLNGDITDRFADNCFTDDTYRFYATSDRLYVAKSGSQKCGDEESEVISSWGYSSGTTSLSIVIPILSSFTLPFIVRDVDDNDMVLEIFFDETGTESYRIHFELTDEE